MRRYTLILLCTIYSVCAAAQDKLSVSVSHTTVPVGQTFRVTWSVNAQATEFRKPDFAPFRMLSGPNFSSSTRIIQGQVSMSMSYSFDLMAVKEGVFTIPPASIRTASGVITSDPVKIEVVKGGSAAVPAPPQARQQVPENNGSDLFIVAQLSKREAYVGEPVLLTFKVYFRVEISQNQVRKLPSLNGFWTEDFDYTGPARITQETVNGERYNVAEIRKSVLFPQRAGELQIDPMEMVIVVRSRGSTGNSWLDQFFGAYEEEQRVVSNKPVTLKVKNLPTPRPGSFSGAVGNFSLHSELERDQLKANEATRLTIAVKGTGNLKLIEAPVLDFPVDIESYKPEVEDKIQLTNQGMAGSRSWEYLLIPRHEGNFTLEPFEFTYFDPAAEKYVTLSTGPYQLEVQKSDGESGVTYEDDVVKKDVKKINEDIRFISENPGDFKEHERMFAGSIAYFGALLTPAVAFLLFLIFAKRREVAARDVTGKRYRKAAKKAEKRLAHATSLLDTGDYKKFLDEFFHAINGYLADKLNLPVSALGKEELRKHLLSGHVPPHTVDDLIRLLSDAEFARFAPVEIAFNREMVSRAGTLINQIETSIS